MGWGWDEVKWNVRGLLSDLLMIASELISFRKRTERRERRGKKSLG